MINNISNQTAQPLLSSIKAELSQKYAQLNKIDQESITNPKNQKYNDYFEQSVVNGNLDKNDYERVLEKFKNMDAKVRAHEQTHASLTNTTTPIQYNYQMGPDGKMYAVGGSVRLDTSIPNDPKAAINKLDSLISSSTSSGLSMSEADSNIAISANLMKMKLQIQEESSNLDL